MQKCSRKRKYPYFDARLLQIPLNRRETVRSAALVLHISRFTFHHAFKRGWRSSAYKFSEAICDREKHENSCLFPPKVCRLGKKLSRRHEECCTCGWKMVLHESKFRQILLDSWSECTSCIYEEQMVYGEEYVLSCSCQNKIDRIDAFQVFRQKRHVTILESGVGEKVLWEQTSWYRKVQNHLRFVSIANVNTKAEASFWTWDVL